MGGAAVEVTPTEERKHLPNMDGESKPNDGPSASAALAIDYQPMRVLLDGGFVDAGHATSVAAWRDAAAAGELPPVGAGVHNHSVPTRINVDAMHAAEMRLDYAMVSAPLVEACVVRSWLARDEETERLSDHYPLLVDINCK